MIEIVGLTRSLPAEVAGLVVEGERAGYRFVRRLLDDWHSGQNRFDREGEALFGTRVGPALVGVCGLNVDPHAGDAGIGRVRHLYVLEAWRGHGAGRRLVERVLAAARPRFRELWLRTDSAAAAAFYERLGFRAISHSSATHCWQFGDAHGGRGTCPWKSDK